MNLKNVSHFFLFSYYLGTLVKNNWISSLLFTSNCESTVAKGFVLVLIFCCYGNTGSNNHYFCTEIFALRISLKRDSFKEGYLTLAVKIIISAKELDQESRLFVKAIARTSIVICSFVPLQSTIHNSSNERRKTESTKVFEYFF